MKLIKNTLLITTAVLALSGCATTAKNNQVENSEFTLEQIETIAVNLTNAATQTKELTPQLTTVQMNTPSTVLGTAILHNLTSAGYGIQMVSDDQGQNYIRYKSENSTTEEGARIRFSVSIGNIDIYRDYQNIDNRVAPNSPLFIEGVSSDQSITPNDQIFGFTETQVSYIGSVQQKGKSAPVVTTVTQLPPTPLPSNIPKHSFGFGSNAGAERIVTNTIKKNIFYSDDSNYASIFENYEDIKSVTLVFDNESMRLGRENKSVITSLQALINPETDLVSIVGCSHGRTALKNGNGVLAVGRANRVKEAFMIAGVDQDILLDEGCWANGRYHDTMPRRGVVVAIKRKVG